MPPFDEQKLNEQELRDEKLREILSLAIASLLAILIVFCFALGLALVERLTTNASLSPRDLSDLISEVIWPTVVFVIAFSFSGPIRAFLNRLSLIKFKAGETEATLEAREAEAQASAFLGAAAAINGVTREESPYYNNVVVVKEAASQLKTLITPNSLERFGRSKLLWVDDRPSNNTYLIQAFRALSIQVDTALSTEEALEKLAVTPDYAVIITDMGRPGDPEAGYTLLAALREKKSRVPVIVYTSSDLEEHRMRARAAGAVDSTNRPNRVFELVFNFIDAGVSKST